MTIKLETLLRMLFMALIISMLSCDMRTELKEMHKSTQNMEKNTEKMVEITERMEKSTEKMGSDVAQLKEETIVVKENVQQMGDKMSDVNDNVGTLNGKFDTLQGQVGSLDSRIGKVGDGIEETYDGLRQGDSSNLRRIAFQGLIQAKSHEKKLLEAAQYLAGFEFYFWRGFGIDGNKNRREDLVTSAAQQFFKDLYELYNYSPQVFPLADPDLSDYFNKEASFNALAASLHTDNPKQKENIKLMAASGVKIEELNFLKIIKQGLNAKINVEDNKMTLDQVPGHLKEVMINEGIAVKLMQARWNFLAVAALDKSFHFKQNGPFFRYIRSAWGIITKWKLDFSKLNSSQINDQLLYLQQAHATREFLKSIGIKTKPDLLLVMFIKRMTPINTNKGTEKTTPKIQEILKILESFKY